MAAINRHEVDTRIPLGVVLLPVPLLAIRAIPAGRDKTVAPMIDFTRLKISSGTVEVPTDNDEDACFVPSIGVLFSSEDDVVGSSFSVGKDDIAKRIFGFDACFGCRDAVDRFLVTARASAK